MAGPVFSAEVPAPPESAEALHATLRKLIADGRVVLRIDARPLGHIDSPVASEADGNRWIYGAIALAAAVWLWRGPVPALAALAAGIVLYLGLGRAYVRRRIERRARDEGLASVDIWRRLWRFPGLTLTVPERPGLGPCASPDGNWMGFVRALVRHPDSLP